MSDSQPPEQPPRVHATSDRPLSRPPGSGRDSSAHLHAALSASGRAEASLSTLMRAIRDLSSGVSGAREANLQLLRELEAMSDLLGAANEQRLALKNRVALLEQTLERTHVEAQRERAYILDQQDAFIAAMMDDHEQVIAELNRELEALRARASQRPTAYPELPESSPGASPAPDLKGDLDEARRTVEQLLTERDRARETLLKVQAQRDEAQAALVELTQARQARVSLSSGSSPNLRTAPTLPPADVHASATPSLPPVIATTPEDKPVRTSQPVGSLRPRAPELDLTPRELPDFSQTPEELRAAVHAPASSGKPSERGLAAVVPSEAPASSGGTRPGGYSVTNSIAPEHVAGAPRISRAPRQ